MESESEIIERIYGINILEEDDIILLKEKRKLREVIENINISDHLSAKAKPIPLAAPVITATLSLNSFIFFTSNFISYI